ncbi:MAG: glycosyltransferase family 2 protein, partial [Candidatus Bathyarchaeia archaeon]
DPDVLAEDTELTFRLYTKGWKVIYANRVECYEEVPEEWSARANQIRRWSRGHNEAMFKHLSSILRSPYLSLREKLDGILLLFIYAVPILLITGFLDSLALFFLNEMNIISSLLVFLFIAGYNTFGNFAPFYQVGTALFLDNSTRRIRLLPFLLFTFFFNIWYVSVGFFEAIIDVLTKRKTRWKKTPRYPVTAKT